MSYPDTNSDSESDIGRYSPDMHSIPRNTDQILADILNEIRRMNDMREDEIRRNREYMDTFRRLWLGPIIREGYRQWFGENINRELDERLRDLEEGRQ